MKTTELYHYGVKGMKWGVRKDKIKKGVDKAVGSFLGIENKHLNRALSSSGKLRKAYFEAQKLGVKTNKKGQYKYSHDDKELYKKQQAAARKAKRFADEFLQKYNKQPMSYLQSKNAQRGAAIGAAAGLAVPVILPLWATIPAGYYIGSKIGGSNVKHSDELMHYGVKGMKWKQHRMAHEDGTNSNDWWNTLKNEFTNNASSAEDRANRVANQSERLINQGHPVAAAKTFLSTYRNDPNARLLMQGYVESKIEELSLSQNNTINSLGRGFLSGAFDLFNNTVGSSTGSRGRRQAGERRKVDIHANGGTLRGRRKRAPQ